MSVLSVAEVASQLDIDRSRVRQMLRAGVLSGSRVGRDWVVPSEAVASLRERPMKAGRPPAPRRSWALLDLLDGGNAEWLDRVARSHVRAHVRSLVGGDAEAWRNAVRGREDRVPVAGHRAAVSRLMGHSGVWNAGPGIARDIGADLVVVNAVPEVYVPPDEWPDLVRSLHLSAGPSHPDAWVRLPRKIWPFGPDGPGRAALAASLLDGEWRAARAGAEVLNELAQSVGQ